VPSYVTQKTNSGNAVGAVYDRTVFRERWECAVIDRATVPSLGKRGNVLKFAAVFQP